MLLPERITEPDDELTIVNKVLPVITPVQDKLFVFDVPIVEAVFKAIGPAQVHAVDVLFNNAPVLETPVPFNVKVSVALVVKEKAFRSNVAPEATVVPPVEEPKGPLAAKVDEAPNFKVPAETVVVPS